ncbi:MAG: MaoC family dehydratase [Myxococcaceae bacterium]|nr:MaoC family dehydratase [Myxococcaceae bacterium]
MARTRISGPAGVKALAGKPLGTSDWQTMRYEDIKAFADATGDHQWIHVDRERCAKESPFGAPIAHGYLSLSRIGGLFFEVLEFDGMKHILNYGLNKVRFPNPLKAGARYRLVLAMGEVKDVQGGVEAQLLGTIELENEPKPACAAEIIFRFFG